MTENTANAAPGAAQEATNPPTPGPTAPPVGTGAAERLRAGWDAQTREVRTAVGGVLWNASNYPDRVQAGMLGQDTGPLSDKVTDAVLAVLPSPDRLAEQVRALADDWEQAAQPVDDRHGRTILDRVYQAHADDLRALLDSEGGQDRG